MKILLVSNMYPSNKYPSYGVFVKNTEKILKKNGFEIEKIVLCKTMNKLKKIINYIEFYFKIIFCGIFKDFDIMYVHYATHCSIPVLLVKLLKKNSTIYVNLHGSDVVPETIIQERLQKYVKRLLLMATKVIVPSNYFRNYVSNKYKISKNKIFIFPSGGVDKNRFYPLNNKKEVLKKMGLDCDYMYIGYVGRISYKKGWDIFLKSIKLLKEEGKMKNKKALIIGNGKEIKLLKENIEKNDLENEIVWFDLLPQDKLVYAYNSMEVFCFPTMRDGESLGLVGLEAMACGKPVIGSKIGGLCDYIKDGINGTFFEKGNYKMLESKINKYFSLEESKKVEMKQNAIKAAKEYYVDNVEEILVKIFK